MRAKLPILCLDEFTAAAIDAHQRQHAVRRAADEAYRAITDEWRKRWEERHAEEDE
jgi:hypothetical protein